MICAFVERRGQISSKVSAAARNEKSIAKIGAKTFMTQPCLLQSQNNQTKIVWSRLGPMEAMASFAPVNSAMAFRYTRALAGKSFHLRALSVGVRQPSNSTYTGSHSARVCASFGTKS